MVNWSPVKENRELGKGFMKRKTAQNFPDVMTDVNHWAIVAETAKHQTLGG